MPKIPDTGIGTYYNTDFSLAPYHLSVVLNHKFINYRDRRYPYLCEKPNDCLIFTITKLSNKLNCNKLTNLDNHQIILNRASFLLDLTVTSTINWLLFESNHA